MKSEHEKRKDVMKKNSIVWCCCAVMALGILCGCETITVSRTPSPEPVRYDLESATSRLMSKMLSSDAFKRNYSALVKAREKHPVIVVGDIDRQLHRTRSDTEIVRNSVQSSLNESNLFTVRMDGFEGAVDYQVTGYIKSDYDAANPDRDVNPRLHLKILDSSSGQIIWSGTQYDLQL